MKTLKTQQQQNWTATEKKAFKMYKIITGKQDSLCRVNVQDESQYKESADW